MHFIYLYDLVELPKKVIYSTLRSRKINEIMEFFDEYTTKTYPENN